MKTSGERAGPNETLLRETALGWLGDVSHFVVALAALLEQGPVEYRWVVAGERWFAMDSSSSWIDMREVDIEEQEVREREDRLRRVVGVSLRLGFAEEEAALCTQSGQTQLELKQ